MQWFEIQRCVCLQCYLNVYISFVQNVVYLDGGFTITMCWTEFSNDLILCSIYGISLFNATNWDMYILYSVWFWFRASLLMALLMLIWNTTSFVLSTNYHHDRYTQKASREVTILTRGLYIYICTKMSYFSKWKRGSSPSINQRARSQSLDIEALERSGIKAIQAVRFISPGDK